MKPIDKRSTVNAMFGGLQRPPVASSEANRRRTYLAAQNAELAAAKANRERTAVPKGGVVDRRMTKPTR